MLPNIQHQFIKSVGFLLFDIVLIIVVLLGSIYGRLDHSLNGSNLLSSGAILSTLYFIIIQVIFLALFNCYELRSRELGMAAPFRVFLSQGIALAVLSISFLMTPFRYEGGIWGRGVFYGSIIFFSIIAFAYRYFLYRVLLKKEKSGQKHWLIIAPTEVGNSILADLKKYESTWKGSILAPDDDIINNDEMSSNVVGKWSEISNTLKRPWTGIIVDTRSSMPKETLNSLMKARLRGQWVHELTSFYELAWQRLPVFHFKSGWFALSDGFNIIHNRVLLRLKRLYEFLAAIALGTITLPLIIFIFLLLLALEGRPVLFAQSRSGKTGKPFTMFKFRTMKKSAEINGPQWAAKRDPRVTRIGLFLRKTRLDELPQLWNVVKGDMSFIGPRPERPEFDKLIKKEIPFYELRQMVKPGITGWAQVNYPYGASIEDARHKLEYDLYYIKNYSPLLDLKILIKTVRVVLFGKGGR